MSIEQKGASLLLSAFLLMLTVPVLAQQDSSGQGANWQGPRQQQHSTPPPAMQELPSTAPQSPLSPPVQNDGEAHPQVMEMPTPQPPVASPAQPAPTPPQATTATRGTGVPAKPAYLGIAGQTVQECRYPAGVRITRVIEGSPAQQAGLKGEGTLTWQQAMAGVLTMTPLAPLVLPFLSEHEHGGSGDLILAVDGKRVHNREELEKEIAPLRPGDTVYFSILRNDRGLQQVAVRLTEYPDATADSTTAMAR